MLSDAEVAHYHEQGYVFPDYRLPEETLEAIRDQHDRLLARHPEHPEFRDNCPALLNYDFGFLDYARNPEILDMVEQLIGPDIALWNMSFFAKPALNGKRTPWHQDGEYWPIRPLATCSVWIALDAATPENGCLRVIPGSHKDRRVRSHHQDERDSLALNAVLEPGTFDEAAAVDIVLEPGQVSLHDVYLVHGSRPNRSAHRRAGYVLRMMPTSSRFDHRLGAEINRKKGGGVDFATRPIHLLRGRDLCGENDFAIGKAAP